MLIIIKGFQKLCLTDDKSQHQNNKTAFSIKSYVRYTLRQYKTKQTSKSKEPPNQVNKIYENTSLHKQTNFKFKYTPSTNIRQYKPCKPRKNQAKIK